MTTLPSLPSLNTTPALTNDKRDNDAGSRCDSRQSDPVSSLPKSFHFDPDYLLPQLATKETDNPGSQLPQSPTYDPTSPPRRARLNRSESVQKKGLIPLPLGPVVLREPNDTAYTTNQSTDSREALNATRRQQGSDSTQDLLVNAYFPPCRETRETPYQRCGRQSAETLAKRASPTDTITHAHAPSPSVRLFPAKANASSPSLSTSLMQHARDLSNSSSQSTLVDQRSTRNTPRLQRKRSNQSKGSFGTVEDSDVEKEVLELNTIVEERRAENNRNRSPTGHVPAVAPLMQVRARSQTLTDIGSALSRPLAASQNDLRVLESSRKESGDVGPQSSKSNSRVPGWLSSFTSNTTTKTRTTEQTTSYDQPSHRRPKTAVDPRSISNDHNNRPTTPTTSTTSSLTAIDPVILAYTLEQPASPPSSSPSSPTKKPSKRYSRSLMITTPLSASHLSTDFVVGNGAADGNVFDHDHEHDRDHEHDHGEDARDGFTLADERRVGVAL